MIAAAPAAAVAQSFGDRRLPVTTFSFASAGRPPASRRLRPLVDRPRQPRSRTPNRKRACTTLDPIKPVAPVIRTRSPAATTNFLELKDGLAFALSVAELLRDIRLPDGIDFDDGQQFADVVAELYRNTHETIMRPNQRKGQEQHIQWNSDQRTDDVANSKSGMEHCGCPL